MKPNSYRTKPSVAEVSKRIITTLSNEDGLTLDVVKAKVAPQINSVYYHCCKLKNAGLITDEGHTRPLILHLTPRGKEAARKINPDGRANRAQHERSLFLLPKTEKEVIPKASPTPEREPSPFEELSRLHMDVAILLERIAVLNMAA